MARLPSARWSALSGLAVASFAALAAAPAEAGNECSGPRRLLDDGVVSLISENDLFGGTDRNYTNGIQLGVVSGPCEKLWGTEFLTRRLLPSSFDDRDWRAGLAFGQMIFTPQDITAFDPDPADRPYAGWLYSSFTLMSHTDDASGRIAALDTAKLDIGWVGPGAQGEWIQSNWHEAINAKEMPNGWDHQINDEPGINLSLATTRRPGLLFDVAGIQADADVRAGATLGNVETNATVGGSVRLGFNLGDDYGPPRIRPALGGATFFDNEGPWSFYVFAGTEGRAVGRDIFLDGNTFRSSPSVAKEPFVLDAQGGAALRLGNAQVSFTYVHRSESFQAQVGPDRFGAVTLSVRR